jgi:hypothetical protein
VKVLSLSLGATPLLEGSNTMNVEEPLLVTDEPVEVQDFGKITHHFLGIYIKKHISN